MSPPSTYWLETRTMPQPGDPERIMGPLKDGRCVITNLPTELLAYVFTLGHGADHDEDKAGEEDDEMDWESESDGGASDAYSLGHDFDFDMVAETKEDVRAFRTDDVGRHWRNELLTRQMSIIGDDPDGHYPEPGVNALDIPVPSVDSESESESDWEDEGEEHASEEDDDNHDQNFNILISHVCQLWRTVALSTPSLWSKIVFRHTLWEPMLHDEDASDASIRLHLYGRQTAFLERSAAVPLDISIEYTLDEGLDVPEDTNIVLNDAKLKIGEIVKLISPHIHRWEKFDVETNCYPLIYMLQDACAELPGAPMLKTLNFYHYEDEPTEIANFLHPELKKFTLPFHGDAPNLRELVLWGVHVDWKAAASSPMFNSGLLFDVELAYHTLDVRPSWEDFAAMLQNCPALGRFSLTGSGPTPEPPEWPNTDPISLPALKHLVLAYNTCDYMVTILPRLSVPAIETLVLNLDDEDFTEFTKALIASPILPRLATLEIGVLLCDQDSIKAMYARLKSLRNLKLSMTFIDPQFMVQLGSLIDGELAMPQLQALTASGVEPAAVRAVVEARKEFGHPLKKLVMGEGDADEDEEKWFATNVESFELFDPSDEESDDDGMEIVSEGDEDDYGHLGLIMP